MLRDYQSQAVDALRELLRGTHDVLNLETMQTETRHNRAVCLQLATGAGKTPIGAEIIASAFGRDRRVWFVVPRNELLLQGSDHLTRWKVPHGSISAGCQESRAFKVHVVSEDTLLRRLDKIKNWPDLIIFDECHIALDAQIRIIAAAPGTCKVIGVTATPERLDGRGLSEVYDGIHYGPSIPWLTERGFLSPLRYFAPPIEGLEDIHRKGTEFDADELEALLQKRHVYGEVVDYYKKYGKRPDGTNKSALIFCRSVKSAYETAERFSEAGFKFFCIEGTMAEAKRRTLVEGLKKGEIDGLTNCEIATYGLDVPRVEYGASIRPTLSRSLYFQMVGRILRPFEGKDEALFFDHANLVQEHTDPSAPGVPLFYLENLAWNFYGRFKRERAKRDIPLKQCPYLDYQYCGKASCAGCNLKPESEGDPRRAELVVVDATLEERTALKTRNTLDPEEKRDVQDRIGRAVDALKDAIEIDISAVEDLLKVADELGYKPMWAYWKVCDGRITANVPLLHAIAKVRGFKPGWAWFKAKEIREHREQAEEEIA